MQHTYAQCCCTTTAVIHCNVTRYQELEEALTLAEQHLQQHDMEASDGDWQKQIQSLQADLSQASTKTEALHADLQTAESARQKATDELTASLNQQKSLQVGCLVLNLSFRLLQQCCSQLLLRLWKCTTVDQHAQLLPCM